MTETRTDAVAVEDGAVPIWVAEPADAANLPALVVVPSIFGPNPDLVEQARSLADIATTVVMDPFWRQGGGAVPYGEHDAAIGRLADFDRSRCRNDVAAVAQWAAARSNGRVVGLGICFGGPWVLTGAAHGLFAAAATWHGSRMEGILDRLDGLDAPLRLHFGELDTITPPDVIAAIDQHFRGHEDCRIVVHPGAAHGFSHEGPAWDPAAAAAGMADVRSLLEQFATSTA
ncbi:MAG: dienelactone hydrolase family protein [Acidimicrobiales bacterium]